MRQRKSEKMLPAITIWPSAPDRGPGRAPATWEPCIGVRMKPRAWLILGPLLFCLLDGGLTLHGQSGAYWEGQYDQAEEMNPIGLWPLQQGPGVFILALCCWIVVFCTAIVAIAENLARPLAFAVQLGHSLGAASWLIRHGPAGWLGVALLLVSSRIILD